MSAKRPLVAAVDKPIAAPVRPVSQEVSVPHRGSPEGTTLTVVRLLAVLAAAAVAGCGVASASEVTLPPPGGSVDYQLGAAYPPAADVTIVARDRTAQPGPGYAICYVNAFQTQPGELADWPDGVLLRGPDGAPVLDPDWPDEVLLDTRTPEQRAAILAVVGGWIDGCAEKGYHAVEFDNLDTYTRSGGVLRKEDAVALVRELASRAHSVGLAAAQKNAAEDAAVFRSAGLDFAVAEECAAYQECERYTAVYGAHVIDIEYVDNLPRPFTQMCADHTTPASVALRDRDLGSPSSPGYHFQQCP